MLYNITSNSPKFQLVFLSIRQITIESFYAILLKLYEDNYRHCRLCLYRSTTVYESKNYYNIAHELKEDVKQQPSILVGGTLKEYQVCKTLRPFSTGFT